MQVGGRGKGCVKQKGDWRGGAQGLEVEGRGLCLCGRGPGPRRAASAPLTAWVSPAGGAEQKAASGFERLQGPPTPAGKETEGSLSDSDFKEPPSEGRLDALPGPPRAGGPSPAGPAAARLAEDPAPHYSSGAPAPGPHPAAGELPPGPGGPSVIHSPPPPPPQAVLAKPKLWSLAEIDLIRENACKPER